jgi:four helix bundle protein
MNEERGYKKLRAWQKADELACAIFLEMGKPPAKPSRLVSQVSRAAVSVPANLAEGYGRGSLGDYLRFLDIALGSLAELEYYLHFMARTSLLAPATHEQMRSLESQAAGLLVGLSRSLKAKAREGSWDHSRLVREDSSIYESDLDHFPRVPSS